MTLGVFRSPAVRRALAAAVLSSALAAGLTGPADAQEAGGPMFPTLVERAGELSQLVIQGRRYSLRFELRDGVWVAADRGDYPIRADLLIETVEAMSALRAFEVTTEDVARHDALEVVGPGPGTEAVHVLAAAANGDVLADAIIGLPAPIMGPPPRSGTYVRNSAEAAVWLADGGLFFPSLIQDWFEPLLSVPGREVGRIGIMSGERLLFDAIKIDFTTGDYELAFLDDEFGGATGTANDNSIRALAQGILSTVFINARLREAIPVPPDARMVRYETQGGLTLDITVVDFKGEIWVTYTATAAPGSEAAAQAADITARTSRWTFQLPEATVLTLTREIAGLVNLPAVEVDPAMMP